MSVTKKARGSEAKLICIACPVGCRLSVVKGPDDRVSVSGNRCPRGEVYGQEEILAPRRMVTAVVPTDSAAFPCAPVRTEAAIARALITPLLQYLYARRVSLPVRLGQTLLEDYHGVRVIFTRTLPPDEVPPIGEAGAETEGHDKVSGLQQFP